MKKIKEYMLNTESADDLPEEFSRLIQYSFASSLKPASELGNCDAAIIGVPYDGGAVTGGGNAAPAAIRHAWRDWVTYCTELRLDMQDYLDVTDLGDIMVDRRDAQETLKRVEEVTAEVLDEGVTPVLLGGDHSITYGSVKALCNHVDGKVGIIWFDAHFDTLDDYFGDKWNCGTPVARIVELEGHPVDPKNIVFIGLRGFHNVPHHLDAVPGCTVFTPEDVEDMGVKQVMEKALEIAKDGTDGVYLTFDIDSVDVTYAPGIQYPGPVGGMTSNQVRRAIRQASMAGVDCMDIVEMVPAWDRGERAALLASTLVLDFLAGLAYRKKTLAEA